MKRDLANSILRQEPRVSNVNIDTQMQAQQGYIMVYIDYVLTETNTRDNMVFPFYLNAEPEVSDEEEYYEPEIIDTDDYYE